MAVSGGAVILAHIAAASTFFYYARTEGNTDAGCPDSTTIWDGGACGKQERQPFFIYMTVTAVAVGAGAGLPLLLVGLKKVPLEQRKSSAPRVLFSVTHDAAAARISWSF